MSGASISQSDPIHIDPAIILQDGRTGLFWAAKSGYVGVIQLLLTRGANPNARDNVGLALPGTLKAVGLPPFALQGGSFPLLEATANHHASAVEALLADDRIDVNAVNPVSQISALNIVVHCCTTFILQGGSTALHGAASQGSVEIVRLLLRSRRDLDVNARSAEVSIEVYLIICFRGDIFFAAQCSGMHAHR